MFYFAYDGTIHGDWVSHYALRLAAQHPDRELRLLYVDEGRVEPRQLDEKLALINAAYGSTLFSCWGSLSPTFPKDFCPRSL